MYMSNKENNCVSLSDVFTIMFNICSSILGKKTFFKQCLTKIHTITAHKFLKHVLNYDLDKTSVKLDK